MIGHVHPAQHFMFDDLQLIHLMGEQVQVKLFKLSVCLGSLHVTPILLLEILLVGTCKGSGNEIRLSPDLTCPP